MAGNPDLLQTLITLEELRRDAWLKRDAKELRDLMAEDFMEINYFGRLTKADILDDLFHKLTLDRFTMEDFRVLTACDDAATLTYHTFEKITYEGSEVPRRRHVCQARRAMATAALADNAVQRVGCAQHTAPSTGCRRLQVRRCPVLLKLRSVEAGP